ncbi:hypothetical protein FOB41_04420 [Agrobacterium pusense]|uniref:Uncharacterized protein n=1 Tax=Agrobacterium pusense TaxID=648995 RepID=A0A6H0ZJU8_9HYPH|nr:hypothetical protein [Agrobacterium pusense]QIX20433.1 hypothetical protein FOB41_04420 [Agrobacterium pusense]
MAAAEQQREWQLEDRTEERAYNRTQLDESRAYDRAQLDEARAYSRTVLGNLVEDATNAGFNPLTLVRSGAASNYNAGAGFAPLSSTPLTASPSPARQAPVRQAVGGSVAADAVGAVGDFMSNFDPFADSKREQEYRLVESQIAALNASALSGIARGAGSFAQGDFERRPSGAGGALSKKGPLGHPGQWEPGDVTVTNPFKSEPVNPNVSDAAVWEQRYGEPGSWVGGVWVGFNDLTDAGARYIDKAGKAVTNWIGSGYRRAAAQLSGGKKSKPKQKDTFSDPFPPWAW